MKLNGKKIYIVYKQKQFGDCVAGIFSTKKLAQDYINKVQHSSPLFDKVYTLRETICVDSIDVSTMLEKVYGVDYKDFKYNEKI